MEISNEKYIFRLSEVDLNFFREYYSNISQIMGITLIDEQLIKLLRQNFLGIISNYNHKNTEIFGENILNGCVKDEHLLKLFEKISSSISNEKLQRMKDLFILGKCGSYGINEINAESQTKDE